MEGSSVAAESTMAGEPPVPEQPESKTVVQRKRNEKKRSKAQNDPGGEIGFEALRKAVKDRTLSELEKLIASHPQALTATFMSRRRTPLHFALQYGYGEIAAFLVERMTAADLEVLLNTEAGTRTALAFAASTLSPGLLPVMELMVTKNPRLPDIVGDDKLPPVVHSSYRGFSDTIRFLYGVTDEKVLNPKGDKNKNKGGVDLLVQCIHLRLFDISKELVEKFPNILLRKNSQEVYPTVALAKTISAPTDGIWSTKPKSKMGNGCDEEACAFLRLVSNCLSKFDREWVVNSVRPAMFEAAKNGTIEFIYEMLRAHPDLIYAYDDKSKRGMLVVAIENRQERVFNLIYGVKERDKLLGWI